MLWSVKSKDLHIEVNEAILRYIFAALGSSEREEKKEKVVPEDEGGDAPRSPKKKRRLKRRKSQETKEEDAGRPADVPQEPDESRWPAKELLHCVESFGEFQLDERRMAVVFTHL